MSAWVHGFDHIDLLVSRMIRPAGGRADSVRAFQTDKVGEAPGSGWDRVETQRAPFSGIPYVEVRSDNATEIGLVLLYENVASVHHRYPDDETMADLPGPIDLVAELARYQWRQTGLDLPIVAVLKAADSYVYQSCEHDGWETSLAKALIDNLRVRLIERLPGYSEAQTWAYKRPASEPRSLIG